MSQESGAGRSFHRHRAARLARSCGERPGEHATLTQERPQSSGKVVGRGFIARPPALRRARGLGRRPKVLHQPLPDVQENLQVRMQSSEGWHWWEFRVLRDGVEVASGSGFPSESEAIRYGFISMGMDVDV